MKAILKPEEERIVTPGPKAVEDLLILPDSPYQGSIVLKNVKVRDRSTIIEEHASLEVTANAFTEGSNPVGFTQAVTDAHMMGGWLPSSALSFAVLCCLYDNRKSKKHRDLLERYVLKEAYWVNTLIDWKTEKIVHYPGVSDFIHPNVGLVNAQQQRHQIEFHPQRTQFELGTLIKYRASGYQPNLLRSLTGISDLEHLKKAAAYVGKTVSVYLSRVQRTDALVVYSRDKEILLINRERGIASARMVRQA